jgi:N,N'-diacetyllegionaminate synthase
MFNENVFIIAEIGGNHEGDFDYARKLTDLALESDVDAVKFQVYRGDRIANKLVTPDRNAHFKKFELEYKEYEELARHIQSAGKEFMASIWDEESLEIINPLVTYHKAGSGDITNYPLLKKLVLTKKPVILSTAMSELEEIINTVHFLKSVDPESISRKRLCLLHCVAMYGNPKPEYANLDSIRLLKEQFPDIHIGYSDHTIGIEACEIAITLGAKALEVHFTNDKSRDFRDHHISKTKEELITLRKQEYTIKALLGEFKKAPIPEVETKERIKDFRRGIYPVKELLAGSVLTEEVLTTLRPCEGTGAESYFAILGKTLKVKKKALEPIYDHEIS